MSSQSPQKRKLVEFEKNPIAMLQELCTREVEVLLHEDIPNEADSKMFGCLVNAFDLVAKGFGRSKKEAKHEGCANLIAQLAKTERFKHELRKVPEIPRPIFNGGDAIGALLDICVQHEWPIATFEELQASGEPHRPLFTFVCKLSSVKRIGTFTTKRGAKQIAARRVLEIIQNFSQNDEKKLIATVDAEPPEKTLRRYREIRKLPTKPTTLRLRDRHNFFLRLPEADRNEAIKILMDDSMVIYGTNKDKVDLICKALKLKYAITDVPNHQQQFKAFNLIENFDCVLVGKEDNLCDLVIDYMKTMLNLQTF